MDKRRGEPAAVPGQERRTRPFGPERAGRRIGYAPTVPRTNMPPVTAEAVAAVRARAEGAATIPAPPAAPTPVPRPVPDRISRWNAFASSFNSARNKLRILGLTVLANLGIGAATLADRQEGLPYPHADRTTDVTPIAMGSAEASGSVSETTESRHWAVDDVRHVPSTGGLDLFGSVDLVTHDAKRTTTTFEADDVPYDYAPHFDTYDATNQADLDVTASALQKEGRKKFVTKVFGPFSTSETIRSVQVSLPPDSAAKLVGAEGEGVASSEAGPRDPESVIPVDKGGSEDPKNISLAEGRATDILAAALKDMGVAADPNLIKVIGTEGQFTQDEWDDLLAHARRLGYGKGKKPENAIYQFIDAANKGCITDLPALDSIEKNVEKYRSVTVTVVTESGEEQHRTFPIVWLPLLLLLPLPRIRWPKFDNDPGPGPTDPPEPPPPPPPPLPPPPEPPPPPPWDSKIGYPDPKNARNTGKSAVIQKKQVGIGMSSHGGTSMPRGKNNRSGAMGAGTRKHHTGKR